MAGSIATAYIDVIPSFKGFKKSVNAEMRGLDSDGRKHGQKLGEATAQGADRGFKGEGLGTKLASKMGKSLKAGAIGAGVAVGGVLAGSIAKGMGRLDALDQAKSKMEGLKLSSGEVSRAMDGVNASVKGTAFGLDEAAGSAAKFIGVGTAVGNELDRSMKLTADIAAQAGTGMDDISSILAKISGAGKLTGETLAQLDDRAVGAAGALSKHLGISIDEVRDKVSKGEIDLETFSKAMEEHVGGAALKTGDTVKGAMDNMMSALGRVGATALTPLFDSAPVLIGGVTKIFDEVNDALKPAAEQIGASLAPAFEKLGETLSTKVAPFAGEAAGKIGELVAKLVDKAVDPSVWEKVGTAFGQVADVARDLGPALGDLASSFATVAGAITVSTWQVFAAVLNALSPLLSSVLVPLVEQVAKFAEQNPGAVQAIVTAFLGFKAVGAVAGPVKNASNAIKGLGTATSVLKGFGSAGGMLGKIGQVGGAIGKLGGQLAKFGPVLARIGKAAFTLIRSLNPIGVAITVVTTALGLFFTKTEMGQRVWQEFMDKLKEVYDWIKGVFGQVFDWLGEKITTAFDGITNAATGFVDGIKNVFGSISDLMKGVYEVLFKGEVPDTGIFGLNDESGASFNFLFSIREAVLSVHEVVVTAVDWMKAKWEEFATGVGQFVDFWIIGGWERLKAAASALWGFLLPQWDALKAKWGEFAEAVGLLYETFIRPVWDLFIAGVQGLWDFLVMAWDGIKMGWDLLGQGFQIVWETVIMPVWDAVKAGAQALWDLLKLAFEGIKTAFSAMGQGIQVAWNSVIKPVWDLFVAGAQLLWDGVRGVFGFIGSGFQAMGHLIQQTWSVVISPVLGIMRQMFGVLADVLTGNFANIGQRFAQMGDLLSQIVSGVINGAMEFFKSILQGVQTAFGVFKEHAVSMVNAVGRKMNEMVNGFKRLPGQIKNVFAGAGRWLYSAGQSIIQGLINGIKSMGSSVWGAIKSVIPHQVGGLIGFAGGGLLPGLASGGPLPSQPGSGLLPRIPGIPRSQRDPILALNRGGIPIARIEPEEFIVNREDTRKNLPLLRAVNDGAEIDWAVRRPGRRAGGPQNTGGLPAYAGGGIVGAMTSLVKQKFPMLTMTSGMRSGDSGYHGRGMAADFSNGNGNTPQQLALARAIAQTYPDSAELIYDSPGWSGNIKNGKTVGAFGQFYTMGQAGPHHHHVHWAMTSAPTKPLGEGPASGGSSGPKPAPVQNLGPSKWSEKNLTVNAVRAMRALQVKFPQIKTIGGWRANDPYPDHPSGRALDIMTYSDMSLGDQVKDWLFNNDFKMQYALWRQAQWNSASARQGMADRGSGTANHMDHVHAYFAASPRATGNEKYTMPNGAGGGTVEGAAGTGDNDSPQQKEKRTIQRREIDWGTASNLANEWGTLEHRNKQLNRWYERRAKVYDTGGILPTGGIAINKGKPERILPAGLTQSFDRFVNHVPRLANSMDKFAAVPWAGVSESMTKFAAQNTNTNNPMLNQINKQVVAISDGLANLGKSMALFKPSEAVGLADEIGSIFGLNIGEWFGGIASGIEGMQDAIVMQMDAADAVVQAENNLRDVRAEAAEIFKDGTEEEKLEATKAVEAAEQDLAKAHGATAMAAKNASVAAVHLAVSLAKFVIKAIRRVIDKITELLEGHWKAIGQVWSGVSDMMGSIRELNDLVTKQRELVTGLALDFAMAQIEVAAALRNVRITQLDGVRAQLEGAKTVAEAQAKFEAQRRKDMRLALSDYDGLSLAYDRWRWSAKSALDASLESMVAWSDETHALYAELQAARIEQLLAEKRAQEANLEATYKHTLAVLDLRDVTTNLGYAAQELAILSGKSFGMGSGSAMIGQRIADLYAEQAQLKAQQGKNRFKLFSWHLSGAGRAAGDRISQIDQEIARLQAMPQWEGWSAEQSASIQNVLAQAGRMGRLGGADHIAMLIKGSALGDPQRALEEMKLKQDLLALEKQQDSLRSKVERGQAELEYRQKLDPLKTEITGLESEKAGYETWAEYYRTQDAGVRDALQKLAEFQSQSAAEIKSLAEAAREQQKEPITLVGSSFNTDDVARLLETLGHRVERLENPRPSAADVALTRR